MDDEREEGEGGPEFFPQDGPGLFDEVAAAREAARELGEDPMPVGDSADPTEPMALYRRYRPEVFSEVIGQEHVTAPLQRALANNRVNHAYLFSGPRGCGKTSSARILARSLNCEQGPTPNPCGVCQSCRDLGRGGPGSIDVIEIDAASHGGVDDARDLRERAFFAPVHSRYKIYIVDEAHMVSPQGFNALLKLVEEPPPHVKFIFATTEPEKVIGTIRSRTHHYPFRLIPPKTMAAFLSTICEEEHVSVETGVLPMVVRAGGGSVRDSLSILDQLFGGAPEAGVGYAQAAALLGYTPDSLLDSVVDAIAADDASGVFAGVDKVIETGQDPRRFTEDLLTRLRDLVIVAAVPDALATGLIDVPEDQGDRYAVQAKAIGIGSLTRAAEVLAAGLVAMRGTTAPRLQLELMCARILLPGADSGERGIHARLERLERRLGITDQGSGQSSSVAASGEPSGVSGRGSVAERSSGRGAVSGAGQSSGSRVDRSSEPAPGGGASESERSTGSVPGARGGVHESPGRPMSVRESGSGTDEARRTPSQPSDTGVAGRGHHSGAHHGVPPVDERGAGASAVVGGEAGRGETGDHVGAAMSVDGGEAVGLASAEPSATRARDTVPSSDGWRESVAGPTGGRTSGESTEGRGDAARGDAGRLEATGSTPAGASVGPGSLALTTEDIRRSWPNVLKRVSSGRRYIWMILTQYATVTQLNNTALWLTFSDAGARDNFNRAGGEDHVAQAILSELGATVLVRARLENEPIPADGRTAILSVAAPGMGRPGATPTLAVTPPTHEGTPTAPAHETTPTGVGTPPTHEGTPTGVATPPTHEGMTGSALVDDEPAADSDAASRPVPGSRSGGQGVPGGSSDTPTSADVSSPAAKPGGPGSLSHQTPDTVRRTGDQSAAPEPDGPPRPKAGQAMTAVDTRRPSDGEPGSPELKRVPPKSKASRQSASASDARSRGRSRAATDSTGRPEARDGDPGSSTTDNGFINESDEPSPDDIVVTNPGDQAEELVVELFAAELVKEEQVEPGRSPRRR
ncbi:MAG: DNA polymerase III subunit gamma and tau [Propionibacteriaceae bacterium]|jgi:DNA polymerase-3 subunit gamma/tau|nr:DNA polymerase III subunit gamma and tau [Propionibacteriaceae bacterium]